METKLKADSPKAARLEKKMKNLWPMRIIGTAKLLSGLAFLALGLLTMRGLLNQTQHDAWREALNASVPVTEYQFIKHDLFERILTIPPARLKSLQLVMFFYAMLHGIEGIGLICGQTWAEWLVVANTGLFVPWEVYEIFHSFSPWRVVLLLVNLAIMAYFIARLLRQHKLHKLEHQGSQAAPA